MWECGDSGPSLEGGGAPFTKIVGKLRQQLANGKGKGREGKRRRRKEEKKERGKKEGRKGKKEEKGKKGETGKREIRI